IVAITLFVRHRLTVFCVALLLPPLGPATPACPTLSLHDALPISRQFLGRQLDQAVLDFALCSQGGKPLEVLIDRTRPQISTSRRSEEHTSELQSRENLVCRLLLETKNTRKPAVTQRQVPTTHHAG